MDERMLHWLEVIERVALRAALMLLLVMGLARILIHDLNALTQNGTAGGSIATEQTAQGAH